MGLLVYTAGPVSPTEAILNQAKRCVGKNNLSYVCESGYCCENQKCCDYFFELWWFWLLCAIILILTCCCVCRYRRLKHRQELQQRQSQIVNHMMAFREASSSTRTPFYFRFLPSYFLPDYEDETNHPLPPPPPYSNLNTEPPACTNSDHEEAPCLSRQATPVPSPDLMGHETSRESQQRDNGAHQETMLTQDMDPTDPEMDVEKENSEILERRRHFTGDSGIEVCLCSRGTESHRPIGLEVLLSNEGPGSSMGFCDICGTRADKDSTQGTPQFDTSPPIHQTPPQLQSLCLCLHTINEQEGDRNV